MYGDVLNARYYQQVGIFQLNLDKAVFKLMQNLTSKLQLNGSLFSGKVVVSCSW